MGVLTISFIILATANLPSLGGSKDVTLIASETGVGGAVTVGLPDASNPLIALTKSLCCDIKSAFASAAASALFLFTT